ncbi:MAG: DegT/DnrJ/EryC1/StrS family aminotransferase [Gammaproteobacteria bacterium]|nr:DegT/DnrJ/EryC1/StrS family aminotransferase [Gammaproteobacteria bacterium]
MTEQVPFIDLHAQLARIRGPLEERLAAIFEHCRFIMGPEIAEMEASLAEHAGVSQVVSCSSGTDALLLPLMARGIGPGDAVFTTPFTFVATAEVISLTGATPVFVDIREDTFNIDPERLGEAIGRVLADGELRPAAVIPVDLFGLPADYAAIDSIAREHGLFVIEDAAQSFGARCQGRPAGSFGHVAATSFFPAKPLGCYGDGGAVFTDDGKLAERMRSIRVHGEGRDRYENVRIGVNARMDTIQAAVILEKLKIFPDEIARRQEVADHYQATLDGAVRVPRVPDGYQSSWACYSVLHDQRDALVAHLREHGVPTAIYYPIPLHQQQAYRDLGYAPGSLPVAESCAKRIFSLPIHAYLSEQHLEAVSEAVHSFPDGF